MDFVTWILNVPQLNFCFNNHMFHSMFLIFFEMRTYDFKQVTFLLLLNQISRVLNSTNKFQKIWIPMFYILQVNICLL